MLMWLVTAPFALLLLLALVQLWGMVRAPSFAPSLLLLYLPMYVYVWAIWMVRQALKALAGGALFDMVVPRLLLRVGLALFFGALFNVIGTPLLTGLLLRQMTILGFDGAAVTLGVIGATLVLVAQLLRQAGEMRVELDEII